MPWKETRAMDERGRLVYLVQEGESVAEAARQCGVSRKTAHKWLARHAELGLSGLTDRSSAALTHPNALTDEVAERVIELRAAHPTWGPRKLMHWLREHESKCIWPVASTIGRLLKERGLTIPRSRRRPLKPYTQPLEHCTGPNRVWCADFKGWFHTGDGKRCDPLTISDGYSRYLLQTRGLAHPTFIAVRPLFEATLREYGLPEAIRTDNGVPFASTTGLGLSRLAVWWIDLGITPERIMPGCPEQNGRHERMHRTLKLETLKPPAHTLRQQQFRFDTFRNQYNNERPHEALEYRTPADVYRISPRSYPSRLKRHEYRSAWKVCRVYRKGCFYHAGTNYFLTDVLGEREIALAPTENEEIHLIYYGHVCIGLLNQRKKRIGAPPRNATPLE